MIITKKAIPRRTVLRGFGASLALPLLDAMVPAFAARTNAAAVPVIRFGVLISDWKYILVATLVGYLVPFFFRLKFGIVPLWFVTGIGSAAISYGFFRYTKVGRKPYWFQHSIKALFEGSRARRTFPADRLRRARSQWLLTAK